MYSNITVEMVVANTIEPTDIIAEEVLLNTADATEEEIAAKTIDYSLETMEGFHSGFVEEPIKE